MLDIALPRDHHTLKVAYAGCVKDLMQIRDEIDIREEKISAIRGEIVGLEGRRSRYIARLSYIRELLEGRVPDYVARTMNV